MIERTLVLLKPDAVQRALVGEIVTRFERVGLKIVGLKMVLSTDELGLAHYTEDITKRKGEHIRKGLVEYLKTGPVIAFVLEGVSAIEVVRKMTGPTEPKAALPGTIRGDFAHVSYAFADDKRIMVKNLIHASSDKADAEREVKLWFKESELHSFRTVHDIHLLE